MHCFVHGRFFPFCGDGWFIVSTAYLSHSGSAWLTPGSPRSTGSKHPLKPFVKPYDLGHMTASHAQFSSRWPVGRVAAALLFAGGAGWAITFARRAEFPKVYLLGYVVWALWGLRAFGLSHPRFRSVAWAISTFWHLVWFLFVIWLLPGLFMLIWTVGLQMAWTVIAFLTSLFIWKGDPRRQ